MEHWVKMGGKIFSSSHPDVFYKKGVLRNFAKWPYLATLLKKRL